jgi:hypothetical protein
MNFAEFQSLSENDQLTVVIDYLPIATREEGGYTVLLNKVEDFFVEIYFDINETKVASIRAIEALPSFEMYWQCVSIKEITRLLA